MKFKTLQRNYTNISFTSKKDANFRLRLDIEDLISRSVFESSSAIIEYGHLSFLFFSRIPRCFFVVEVQFTTEVW